MANPTNKGNGMDEMQVVEKSATVPTTATFATRLKAALEHLPVGNDKALQVKTREDRQVVTNVVTQMKKKLNLNFTTKLVSKRGEDGKMVIEIENHGPITAPTPAAAAPQAAD